MIIIGIDPGVSGALAVIDNTENITKYDVMDLPIIVTGKTSKRKEIDPRNLYLMLEEYALVDQNVIVYLEKVHALPNNGVRAAFSSGHTSGIIKGVVSSLGFQLELVTPQAWKKYFNLTSDKELARSTAIQKFPNVADKLKRKKDADRAEALLIAKYGLDNE